MIQIIICSEVTSSNTNDMVMLRGNIYYYDTVMLKDNIK